MARAGWSQAPDEDAASMYLEALGRLDARGLRAVRDLERRAARPSRAAQRQVLAGRGVARLRVRGALDPGRRPLAQRSCYHGLCSVESPRVTAVVAERRMLEPGERVEDALFTGLRLTAGLDLAAIEARYGVDVWASIRPRTCAVRRRRSAGSRAKAPLGLDPARDAAGQRGHGGFHLPDSTVE